MKASDPISVEALYKKLQPTSLLDYDAIGFDIDHTLVKYKIKPFTKMVYISYCEILVEQRGYPVYLLEVPEEVFDFPLNGIIIDKKTGFMLKLGPNKLVLRAYRGLRRLTAAEVFKNSYIFYQIA